VRRPRIRIDLTVHLLHASFFDGAQNARDAAAKTIVELSFVIFGRTSCLKGLQDLQPWPVTSRGSIPTLSASHVFCMSWICKRFLRIRPRKS
jgi:hypothetical protein